LLSPEIEEELKKELTPLWLAGLSGSEIADRLGFGKGKYEKLKGKSEFERINYVYYYRKKFGLPNRRPHYKFGKQEEIMDLKSFIELLESSRLEKEFFENRRRAFLILLYWTGLRKSEIYERKVSDFVIDDKYLIIYAPRKKKKQVKILPLYLPRKLWGIEEVISWIKQFKDDERPFNFNAVTAWNYVKIFEKKLYPHYFRLNRVTLLCDNPDVTVSDLRAWFDFHPVTIDHYLGRSTRIQKKMAEKMLKSLEEGK
jgi:integrase